MQNLSFYFFISIIHLLNNKVYKNILSVYHLDISGQVCMEKVNNKSRLSLVPYLNSSQSVHKFDFPNFYRNHFLPLCLFLILVWEKRCVFGVHVLLKHSCFFEGLIFLHIDISFHDKHIYFYYILSLHYFNRNLTLLYLNILVCSYKHLVFIIKEQTKICSYFICKTPI